MQGVQWCRLLAFPQFVEFGARPGQRRDQYLETHVFRMRRLAHPEDAEQVERAVDEIRIKLPAPGIHEGVPHVVARERTGAGLEGEQFVGETVVGKHVEHRIQHESRRLVQIEHALHRRRHLDPFHRRFRPRHAGQ